MIRTVDLEHYCALPTELGVFRMYDSGREDIRIVTVGDIHNLPSPPLVRVHSSCMASEVFGALDCDCADQLRGAMQLIAKAEGGLVVHLHQEGRGYGLSRKIRAIEVMQREGVDTVEAFERMGLEQDPREYRLLLELLEALGIEQVRLITNNPRKVDYLAEWGIEVVERVSLRTEVREENRDYLISKRLKLDHHLEVGEGWTGRHRIGAEATGRSSGNPGAGE